MNADQESERHATSADFHEIAICYHQLNTRVAVLETRIDNQEHQLHAIESKTEKISLNVQTILDKLNNHILDETEIQKKVLAWTIATMVSASIGIASVIGKFLLFRQ